MTHRRAIAGQGGAAAWTPALPTPDGAVSPVQWFDAAAITGLSDGAAVASWPDLSGNDYHAAQATAELQPTYETGVLNGRPVVRFDGGDKLVHSYSHGANPGTVFAVAKRTGDTLYSWYFIYQAAAPSTPAPLQISARTYSQGNWGTYAPGAGLYGQCYASYSMLNLWRICCLKLSSGTSLSLYTDSYNPESYSPPRYWSGDSNERRIIGGMNGVDYLIGDIAEIVVYSSVLSDADRITVRDYLNAKWAVY